jgi:hypothetical protein
MFPGDTSTGPERRQQVDNEGPGLRDVAQLLATPARGGLALTKDSIGRIATDLALPVGFAERSQMLVNAFRAAAELDRLPALLAALGAEVDRWDGRYAAWEREYPASQPIWREWREKLASLRTLLAEMAAVANRGGSILEPNRRAGMPAPVDEHPEYVD